MLNRKVEINGSVYTTHELAQVTLVVGDYAVATVRSDGILETSYSLAWQDGLTVAEWESLVWELPEFAEWHDPQDVLDEVLDILTDEQAEGVTDLFREWVADTEYAVGNRVKYDGKLYRCVQAHTSQEGWEPDKTPALWVRTSADPIPDWVQPTGAQDAYALGDRVRHGGKVWESLVDANVWEPSESVPTLWAEVS